MTIQPLSPKPILINNRYELIEKLGEGGMGAVYRAIDRVNEEVVALKQVKLAKSLSDAGNETNHKNMTNRLAISAEFKALASLHHPNIIGVLDYGWDSESIPFFTMRYLENTQTLIVGSQRATTEQRLDYFVQLMQALMYVHRRGIVHRDLKPDNILLTAEGKVKVLDFGIAVAENAAQEGLLGTLLYMPPEVIQGAEGITISRTADLYAAGLIAYEMFTGQYPFDTKNIKTLIHDILKTYPDLSGLPKVKSDAHKLQTRLPLETVIGRLISKDQNFRYDDAADVIIDLSKVIGKESISESTEVRESFLQAATFVGRKSERKFLLTQLRDLKKEYKGSTILIGGESGVGKSRLMEELRIQALVQGIIVYRGQALSNAGLPFQLWRDIVRKLLLATDISDKHASFLSEIVPDIQELLGREIPPLPKLSTEAIRKNLINSILSLFAKQKKPILLLLEDLHWAEDGLDVLREMNQYIDRLPVMIVGDFRDDERPDLPISLPQMEAFKLNRLSYQEIAELSESMLGSVGKKPEIVDLLQRATEGNVFFVVEVVRALAKEAGNLDNIGELDIPQRVVAGGIQMVLQRQLDQVTVEHYEMLKLAAVYGRYIDSEIMGHLFQKYEQALDIWLHDCANVNVLELYEGSWRFTHDQLREHLLDQLSEQEMQELSHEIALVVESLYSDDINWAEILMSLWHSAGQIDKELVYMSVLIRQYGRYSDDNAHVRDYANYALAYLAEDDVRCVDFLNPLSEISWRTGEYQQGYEYATRANELAKQHEYTIGLAGSYNNLGNTAYYLGHYQPAIIYYRHCADIHHELGNEFEWALNLHNIGWTFSYTGDFDSAWDFVEQGQAIFIEMDNYWGIANGYYIMALIATHEGNDKDAIEFHYKSLDIYQEQDDVWGIVLNLNNLGFIFLQLDDIDNAQSTFQDCLKIAFEMNFYGGLLESLVGIAQLYIHYQNPKQAGMLIGVIESHHAVNSDVQLRLKTLKQSLEEILHPDEFTQTIQQGSKLNLDEVILKLIQ